VAIRVVPEGYGAVISPEGRVAEVVIVGPAMIVRANGWELKPPALSVTLMLKLADITAVVGVPLIAPPVKDNPAGSVPPASAKVYPPPEPPVAASVWE
jgi:hypothetical protein